MFKNRVHAGKLLAQKLRDYKSETSVLVLSIPRGGVAVARVVANYLGSQLGVVVTRKIGAPGQEELAIGAIAPDGRGLFDRQLIKRLGVGREYIDKKVKEEKLKIKMRLEKFQTRAPRIKGKIVILVDDGIATGATAEAAVAYLRRRKPKKIVLAIPVAPKDTVEKLKGLVDDLIVLQTPPHFGAVGQFYRDFPQVSDEEVVKLLQ